MAFEADDGKTDPIRKITRPCHAVLLVESNGIQIP